MNDSWRLSYVCDATRISINKHELIINIYETFMGIYEHSCDAVGKRDNERDLGRKDASKAFLYGGRR